MKNYLNFETDIKNLESELDKLKDPYNEEGLSEVDTGRISEIINIGGYNVNPIEVEESILSLNYIESVRVYGRDNSVMGKILCADIKSDIQIEVPEIRKILASKLQPFKIPRIIKQVGDICLTRTGKTKRN